MRQYQTQETIAHCKRKLLFPDGSYEPANRTQRAFQRALTGAPRDYSDRFRSTPV